MHALRKSKIQIAPGSGRSSNRSQVSFRESMKISRGRGFDTGDPILPSSPKSRRHLSVSSLEQMHSLTPEACLSRRKRFKNWMTTLILYRRENETTQELVYRNLLYSKIGLFGQFIYLWICLIFVITSIVRNSTYLAKAKSTLFAHFELASAVFLTFMYCIRFYASPNRLYAATCSRSLLEIGAVIPIYSDLFLPATTSHWMLMLRALRMLLLSVLLDLARHKLERQILRTLLLVICILLSTAGVFQVFEDCVFLCGKPQLQMKLSDDCKCQDLSFFESMYFTIVTITTLGYGDIKPLGALSRSVIATFILSAFVLIPLQVNRLVIDLNVYSKYSKSFKRRKHHLHILLIGEIVPQALEQFLRQFYHPSNPNWNVKVVILQISEPSFEMHRVLDTYYRSVKYIIGSVLNDEDLDRAKADDASVCFIFADKNSKAPQKTDDLITLWTTAIRRRNDHVPIYAQVLLPVNAAHVMISGATDVVCIHKLKLNILGKSVSVVGLPTLVLNLLQHPTEEARTHATKAWETMYMQGCTNSIYSLDIPASFVGFTFSDVAIILYFAFNAVPIMLHDHAGSTVIGEDFILQPSSDNPSICITLSVITESLFAVDDIEQCTRSQLVQITDQLEKEHGIKLRSHREVRRSSIINKSFLIERPDLENDGMVSTVGAAESRRSTRFLNNRPSSIGHSHKYFAAEYQAFLSTDPPKDLSRHVVVCGHTDFWDELIHAVMAPGDRKQHSIVLLSPEIISMETYRKIHLHDNIYFLHGSPLSAVDLSRASIRTANSIIIFSSERDKHTYYDPNMVDADAITTVRFVQESKSSKQILSKKVLNVTVEIDKITNLKFLNLVAKARPRVQRRNILHKLRESIEGSVSLSLTASFINKTKNENKKSSQTRGKAQVKKLSSAEDTFIYDKYYASGRVLLNEIFDCLLSECYRKFAIPSTIHILINGASTDAQHRRLFQIPVGVDYVGQRFISCYIDLIRLGIFPIGIWRGEQRFHPEFVLTNPAPSVVLLESDRLYVVAPLVVIEKYRNDQAEKILYNIGHSPDAGGLLR